MFCPKCGTKNPDNGKFCRSCGTDLGNVSTALSSKPSMLLTDRKGRPITCGTAYNKLFMGLAFVVVSIILGVTGVGRNWWFWLLIPAFGMIGSGIAQYVQYKQFSAQRAGGAMPDQDNYLGSARQSALPPTRTDFVPSAESRYKTGDLMPPSVTENTTRHLEPNPEGETMTLPKSNL